MSKRDEYQSKIENDLALWSARFESMKAKAGTEGGAEAAAVLEGWHVAMEAAASKLEELKRATGDRWDAVKVEVETAWHAIELLLNDGEPRSRIITKDEIASLTPEQQDGILEAMVIAVVSDGKVGDEETARFDRELARIPWAQSRDEIVKKALAARARVAALANDAEKQAMLASIAARLPPTISEKTLGMMAMVMTADLSVDPQEQNTINAFASAFGVGQDRLAALAESLRAESST
jgi:hypothetical protein